MKSNKYWDDIFQNSDDTNLGWYEDDLSQSLLLLNKISTLNHSKVFLAGVGTSLLIEELLSKNCTLILNDISEEAINKVKKRLQNNEKKITWLCQDISNKIPNNINNSDIWVDRAVLHFLKDEDDINNYFNNLKSVLKVNSYAMFAEFSKEGALQCAGLDLHRYDIQELSHRLGDSFELISQFEYTFINPEKQERPYIYALYKRIAI